MSSVQHPNSSTGVVGSINEISSTDDEGEKRHLLLPDDDRQGMYTKWFIAPVGVYMIYLSIWHDI